MEVFTLKTHLGARIESLKNQGKTIGFVPTMGALHEGHLSLIEQSIKENDSTVVSIFVNPTQFDRKDDLEKYPRTLERDLYLLEQTDKNMIVYIPVAEDLYQGTVEAKHYALNGLDKTMEGKYRPGHFDGVATVVHKLFEAVRPHKAYFGEKDFQQLRIIQTLVENLKLPVEIIPVKIYREKDGLAMSSRNRRLKPEMRQAAPFIYQTLKQAASMKPNHSPGEIKRQVELAFEKHPLLRLEYFEIADEENLQPAKKFDPRKKYRGFIAVFAGDVRLIDNIPLN